MGSCERETELRDWVLDELAPEKVKQLERHVEQCRECARSAQQLRELREVLIRSLTDQVMPAHLVFVREQSRNVFVGFWSSLARTAALAVVATCIILAALSVGVARWKGQLLQARVKQQPTISETEIRALVAQALTEQDASLRKQTEAFNEALAASLRQGQMRQCRQLSQRLRYLEFAQNTVWKEAQQRNEIVDLIARSYLQPGVTQPK